jgi:ankyrin repeat protein
VYKCIAIYGGYVHKGYFNFGYAYIYC